MQVVINIYYYHFLNDIIEMMLIILIPDMC